MTLLQRCSPVEFAANIKNSELRGGWRVVLAYDDEGQDPFLVDLSHIPRWDLQHKHLDGIRPLGVEIPRTPGECRFKDDLLISRIKPTQAGIWHLRPVEMIPPPETEYTDVTDATLCLALFGRKTLAITEKLCALDLNPPGKRAPFLLQGPFSHVPCHLVVMEKGPGFDGGLLLTCARGYSKSMVHAILHAGEEFGLRPAGESAFINWITSLRM